MQRCNSWRCGSLKGGKAHFKTVRTGFCAGAVVIGLALTTAGFMPAVAQDSIAVLAASCTSCHGTDGRSPGTMPSLAGLPEEVLATSLAAFKAGEDPSATIMSRIASGFSDDELDALARYFAGLEVGEEP